MKSIFAFILLFLAFGVEISSAQYLVGVGPLYRYTGGPEGNYLSLGLHGEYEMNSSSLRVQLSAGRKEYLHSYKVFPLQGTSGSYTSHEALVKSGLYNFQASFTNTVWEPQDYLSFYWGGAGNFTWKRVRYDSLKYDSDNYYLEFDPEKVQTEIRLEFQVIYGLTVEVSQQIDFFAEVGVGMGLIKEKTYPERGIVLFGGLGLKYRLPNQYK